MSWVDAMVMAILVAVIFIELARATNSGFGIALLDAFGLGMVKPLINGLAHWLVNRFQWADPTAYGLSFFLLSTLVLVGAHLAHNAMGWTLEETFDAIVGFIFAFITSVTLAHGVLQFLVLVHPKGTPIYELVHQSWLARQCLYYEILGSLGETMRNLGNY